MHGLILAGGRGSRLAADGVSAPKPLVPIGNQPQLVRLAATLRRLGCASVTVMVRCDLADPARRLLGGDRYDWLRLRSCDTPSSLHTLAAGLAEVPPGPVLCTMVDTVMPDGEWRRVAAETERLLAGGTGLVLAVTSYVDDESALWVSRTSAGGVSGLGDEPVTPPCVTGGVYGMSPAIRPLAARAVQQGLVRMRAFLQSVVATGAPVSAVDVPRIIDLDRRRDLELAEAWYASSPDAEPRA